MDTTKYQPTSISGDEPPVYNANQTAPVDTADEQPPKYDSIIKQLRKAKENSKNPVLLAQSVGVILTGSILGTVFIAISCALPVAALIIGILYRNDCSMEKFIPIWLIVTGAGGIFTCLWKSLVNVVENVKKRKDPSYRCSVAFNCLSCLVSTFLLGWFVAGNYWIYYNYKRVQYTNADEEATYCHRIVYLFSFWFITSSWLMLTFGCLCFCGIIVCITSAACCLASI